MGIIFYFNLNPNLLLDGLYTDWLPISKIKLASGSVNGLSVNVAVLLFKLKFKYICLTSTLDSNSIKAFLYSGIVFR